MSRSDRLFEIIQLLRSAKAAVTARDLGAALEVTPRTIYRDIVALQSMRVPIEGEAGIGYVMRPGFDLPPLMFSAEEIEAIIVGLALLRRTGDIGLEVAAASIGRKISQVLPQERERKFDRAGLYVSSWGASPPAAVDLRVLRRAIRDEEKLRITYANQQGRQTKRTVRPLAIIYYVEVNLLAAWCELRRDFRHFRLDRIAACRTTGRRFIGQGEKLRGQWQQQHRFPR
jgi:predicted DNA-binding transcriptional regulator YafY